MGCCVIYSLTKAKSDLREKLLDKDKFYRSSTILYEKEAQLLEDWLGNNKKLNLKLLYKATLHGDKASDFWSKCDNEDNVFVFVKSTSGHRFGGYRQVTFTKNGRYKTDAKAFLFSLTHALKCNLKNSNGENAVYYY